jgi:uncharacterized protein (TIGR01319 family)
VVDFGSTYTKAVAFDLANEEVVAVAQTASTVETDISIGLNTAVDKLATAIGIKKLTPDRVFACSSAAGGLRMVAIGLVRTLTAKAAEEAALGAGAKVVGAFALGLDSRDVKRIEEMHPDLILLAGGTDGGDEETIIRNAEVLAASSLNAPVVIAGNKMAADRVKSLLEAANRHVILTENVLPEIDKLNVQPARAAIRETFMRRIVHAKGLDKAQDRVGDIIMPTPMAVLEGAKLLAEGAGDENGLGDLVVVDVGGATTDVHSIANGLSLQEGVVMKGIPEPYAKRTVEGDLGIRYNAGSILEIAGKRTIEERMVSSDGVLRARVSLETAVQHLSDDTAAVPRSEEDFLVDIALAGTAVDIATRRHAGRIKDVYFPTGKVRIQQGKDLMKITNVIGTGGIFAYGQEPRRVLQAACWHRDSPESLRPLAPEFLIDEKYILFAVGLLAQSSPKEALRIIKKHLRKL